MIPVGGNNCDDKSTNAEQHFGDKQKFYVFVPGRCCFRRYAHVDRCVWLHLFSPVWLTSAQDRRLSPSPSVCRCQDGQRSVRQRGITAATGARTRASPVTCGTETIHRAGKIPRLQPFSLLGGCEHIKIEIFSFLFGYTDLLLFLQLFSIVVFWQMLLLLLLLLLLFFLFILLSLLLLLYLCSTNGLAKIRPRP